MMAPGLMTICDLWPVELVCDALPPRVQRNDAANLWIAYPRRTTGRVCSTSPPDGPSEPCRFVSHVLERVEVAAADALEDDTEVGGLGPTSW